MGEGNHRTEEESGSEADLIEELCMEEPGDEVVSCWDDGGGIACLTRIMSTRRMR